MNGRQRGQSLVMMAIIFPFVIALLLTDLEIMERWWERAALEDALRQSTRSAVQLLDYSTLAMGDTTIDPERVQTTAVQFLGVNLTGIRGLAQAESASAIASRVQWTVIPDRNGGTCRFSNNTSQSFIQPALCAEVRVRMRGLLGWGEWQPLITASDTLDKIP